MVTVNFDESTDMDKAEQDIEKALKKVGLPDEAQTSDIKRNSMNAFLSWRIRFYMTKTM